MNRHSGLPTRVVWLADQEVFSVNHLRQIMIEELQPSNFAATTIRIYVKGV